MFSKVTIRHNDTILLEFDEYVYNDSLTKFIEIISMKLRINFMEYNINEIFSEANYDIVILLRSEHMAPMRSYLINQLIN